MGERTREWRGVNNEGVEMDWEVEYENGIGRDLVGDEGEGGFEIGRRELLTFEGVRTRKG